MSLKLIQMLHLRQTEDCLPHLGSYWKVFRLGLPAQLLLLLRRAAQRMHSRSRLDNQAKRHQ